MDDQRRIAEAIADTTIHRAADRTQWNDRVIEAAAKGYYESLYPPDDRPWEAEPENGKQYCRDRAEAAVRAADLARAEAVKAAVSQVELASEDFAQHYVSGPDGKLSDRWREEYKRLSDKQDEARRDLLALLNIED